MRRTKAFLPPTTILAIDSPPADIRLPLWEPLAIAGVAAIAAIAAAIGLAELLLVPA